MCEMCYGLIYDIIVSPLPLEHPLRSKISKIGISKCSSELAELFTKAISKFPHKSDFFAKPFYEEDPQDATGPRVPNTIYCSEVNDIFTWNRFYERYPEDSRFLDSAIDLSRDSGLIKRSFHTEVSIKEFLMYILRKILTLLPDIHYEHTNKRALPKSESRGEAPLWKINQLRDLQGLPKYVPKVPSITINVICDFDDLYS